MMSGIRATVAVANMAAAYLMFRSGSSKDATAINGVLGGTMPLIFIVITGIGLSGFYRDIPVIKTALLALGTVLIVYGTH